MADAMLALFLVAIIGGGIWVFYRIHVAVMSDINKMSREEKRDLLIGVAAISVVSELNKHNQR